MSRPEHRPRETGLGGAAKGRGSEHLLCARLVPGLSPCSRILGLSLPTPEATLQAWLYHLHLVDEEAEAQGEAGLGCKPSGWTAWSLVLSQQVAHGFIPADGQAGEAQALELPARLLGGAS